jgi:outer membrane protein assembly factor BamD
MRPFALLLALALALSGVLVGCSGSGRLSYSGPQDAYQKGVAEMEEEDYQQAIQLFRAVFEYGRGNEWAPQARFKLAMAQRRLNKHLVAANEFKRFTQLYRRHELLPRAEFERANSYYLRSPMYRLGQSDSREAISLFRLFIDRHPNHKRVAEAKGKVEELRGKLAHKKYAAGELYERRDMWKAATTVYEDAFNQYPDTPWADDALFGAVRAYIRYADRSIQKKQAERYRRAIENYTRLTQLFPESDLLPRAEELYSEAQQKLNAVQDRDPQQSLAQENPSRGSN